MRDTTRIIKGELYIDGKKAGHIEGVCCEEKHDREKYTKCMNCKEKEKCTEILKRIKG